MAPRACKRVSREPRGRTRLKTQREIEQSEKRIQGLLAYQERLTTKRQEVLGLDEAIDRLVDEAAQIGADATAAAVPAEAEA